MGGPLSLTLSNIHMTGIKNNVVKLVKTSFYRRFVDDIRSRRARKKHNTIFENLNKYHPKINLTIEVNPCKFPDTKITNNKGNITAEVLCKTSKLPVHWSPRVLKWYKWNAVKGDFHRSKRISSTFEMEIINNNKTQIWKSCLSTKSFQKNFKKILNKFSKFLIIFTFRSYFTLWKIVLSIWRKKFFFSSTIILWKRSF